MHHGLPRPRDRTPGAPRIRMGARADARRARAPDVGPPAQAAPRAREAALRPATHASTLEPPSNVALHLTGRPVWFPSSGKRLRRDASSRFNRARR